MSTIVEPTVMSSRAIGRIDLDAERLRRDLEKLEHFEFNRGYSDYSRGNPGWSNCVLANHSGDYLDQTFGGYEGESKQTRWGAQLDYLSEVVDTTFDKKHLKWVRLFVCEDGMLIPHRDYLDLPEREFLRIHVPLQTDSRSLHSEQDCVYHMNIGEIWFVDGTRVHSAYSYDGRPRIFLTLDFEAEVDFPELFLDRSDYADDIEPQWVQRLPFDEEYRRALFGLGPLLNHDNFDNIVEILSKVHFTREVTCEVVYDWLIDLATTAGHPELIERAVSMKHFFLGE